MSKGCIRYHAKGVRAVHPITLLNNIVIRALKAAGFPAVLKVVGMDRGDGKSGVTIFPFTEEKSAQSSGSGKKYDQAEKIKIKKYGEIGISFCFVQVAIETSGAAGSITASFLKEIGGNWPIVRKTPGKRSG